MGLSCLSKHLNIYNLKGALRSSSQMLLVQPKSGLNHREDRAFAVAAPGLWNNSPLDIHTSELKQSFKFHLKTQFFTLAFN